MPEFIELFKEIFTSLIELKIISTNYGVSNKKGMDNGQ